MHPPSIRTTVRTRGIAAGAAALLAACLATGAEPAGETLSRREAAEILVNAPAIGEEIQGRLDDRRVPVDEDEKREFKAFDDVRDVMTRASEWRWYARDGGILLAISVRQRLGLAAKVESEQALADVVRRLIYQRGLGNPRVQVVFIEPEPAVPVATSVVPLVSMPVGACPCP